MEARQTMEASGVLSRRKNWSHLYNQSCTLEPSKRGNSTLELQVEYCGLFGTNDGGCGGLMFIGGGGGGGVGIVVRCKSRNRVCISSILSFIRALS